MKTMHEAVERFRDHYADRFATGTTKFISRYGQDLFRQLHNALKQNRNVIYLFGNGGSHAIGQCLKYALQSYAARRGLSVRIQTGVDVHQASDPSFDDAPGISFTQILRTEGADARDTIILISGSGDSDNLYAAARYAAQRSIPTFALLGSSRGKICEVVPAERCFCSPFDDQQISEDIIQSPAYFLDVAGDGFGSAANWPEVVSERAEKLKQVIKQIPAAFLVHTADAVVEAFDRGRVIWVLGVDHPALSVCAEHTAHNLYWDGIYQLTKPPRRLIFSSPTACNYSGISNDRRRGVARNLTGINEARGEGLALFYAVSSESHVCRDLLEQLDRAGIPACIFSARDSHTETHANVAVHQTGLENAQMQAGVSQIFGHMLGRLVRLRLLERERAETASPITDPAQFLIDYDLAQRRLLDN